MISNYVTIAWRNMRRNKVYSAINILGLALGMTCALFIFLWVKDELNFNRFHKNEKQIYRLVENQHWGEIRTSDMMPWYLATSLRNEYPEVLRATMLTWERPALIKAGSKSLKKNGVYSNPDLFEIFSFDILEGDPLKLATPTAIVISETLAKSLFDGETALGKTLRLDEENDFQVAAVMKDLPANSSLRFDYVLPGVLFEKENQWIEHWGNHSFRSYLLLAENTDHVAFSAKIKGYLKTKHDQSQEDIFLQPFSDMYLYSNFKDGVQDGGRIEYVRLFSAVAIIILLIACINFMNLATARSAKRAKEVGVRKVIGAKRVYLAIQFVGESVIIALISVFVSMLLVHFLLPVFNEITGKDIQLAANSLSFFMTAIGLAIFTGLIAGSYPAFFLSSLAPVSILKSTLRVGPGASIIRKGLVVFQFSISIILIVGTFVIHRQVNYLRNKELGLDHNNVLYLGIEGELKNKFDLVKQHLLLQPGISSVTRASNKPTNVQSRTTDPAWKGKPEGSTVTFAGMSVDYDFLKSTGIELVEGRDYSSEFGMDSLSYIVNETAVKIMGMQKAVGEELSFWNGDGNIVGVVKDFHLASLHTAIEPLVIQFAPGNTSVILVRTKAGETEKAIASLQKTLKTFNPAYPAEYHFLDEDFERQYKSELVIGKLSNFFAFQAIFIACLGLFGLAAFTAEQRRKEIGIRKVVGATVPGIVGMLSKDFLKLVALSSLISFPLAWWLMQNWLKKFAYPVEISWWIFVGAGSLALVIAMVTISFQAIRAAVANPVKSLRSE